MGNPGRSATPDLSGVAETISTLVVQRYDFYPLVELLLRLLDEDPEVQPHNPAPALLFSGRPSLGFAASDVSALTWAAPDRLQLETTFLGLNGAQSPLPGFLVEQIAGEDEHGVRRLLMDFFNHRLISLLHQIWRKYRYYIRYRHDGSDDFSAQVLALVGLANPHLRGDTPINWSKMLSYAGLLAGRSRSPQVVAGIIAHCFELPEVTIRQWVLRQVTIPDKQRLLLGRANASLGLDTVLGEQVPDRTGKFVICLHELDEQRFYDFLPDGIEYAPLLTLVQFILREQLAFDLELQLKTEAIRPMQLDLADPARLGWTSFTGSTARQCGKVLIQIRQ